MSTPILRKDSHNSFLLINADYNSFRTLVACVHNFAVGPNNSLTIATLQLTRKLFLAAGNKLRLFSLTSKARLTNTEIPEILSTEEVRENVFWATRSLLDVILTALGAPFAHNWGFLRLSGKTKIENLNF